MNLPTELDLFSEEISSEALATEPLPDASAAFNTFACGSTFGCASTSTKGTGGCFGTASG